MEKKSLKKNPLRRANLPQSETEIPNDEDDLLRYQENFLKQGKAPAARVIRRNQSTHQTKQRDVVQLGALPSTPLTEEKLQQQTRKKSKFAIRQQQMKEDPHKLLDGIKMNYI